MTGRLETSLARAAGCEAQALTAVNPHSREAFLKAAKMWRAEAERASIYRRHETRVTAKERPPALTTQVVAE